MSGGRGCSCAETAKPVLERDWCVVMRRHNCSAFSGYRWTPSAYSEVMCLRCRTRWRTKAKYVDRLRDIGRDER